MKDTRYIPLELQRVFHNAHGYWTSNRLLWETEVTSHTLIPYYNAASVIQCEKYLGSCGLGIYKVLISCCTSYSRMLCLFYKIKETCFRSKIKWLVNFSLWHRNRSKRWIWDTKLHKRNRHVVQ